MESTKMAEFPKLSYKVCISSAHSIAYTYVHASGIE